MKGLQPHDVLHVFFKSMMQNQCNVSWSLFSDHTQAEFLKWTLATLLEKHPEAVKASKIGPKEVRMLLERNDSSLMKLFWKKFYISSGAGEYFRFGYYQTLEETASEARIQVEFRYPNGQVRRKEVKVVKQRGGWRFAYLESGLPF